MSLSCECCVLSGRGLCDELISCPEDPYHISVCVLLFVVITLFNLFFISEKFLFGGEVSDMTCLFSSLTAVAFHLKLHTLKWYKY